MKLSLFSTIIIAICSCLLQPGESFQVSLPCQLMAAKKNYAYKTVVALSESDLEQIGKLLDNILDPIKTEMGGLKTEMGGLKTAVGELKTEVGGLKTEMRKLETQARSINEFNLRKESEKKFGESFTKR